ncbi:hypothetical protein BP6252_06567 [Coleophoma cylindrospora]|uniref:Folylpolyglutamate synthase n=1 Tax=Coleophoma cylindrospora TaxID=1849047 RepID=A0A3D8RMZ5_9HELO|nr:hypothetical protein BP6252_06567 [Coleophoma cylindrospora]
MSIQSSYIGSIECVKRLNQLQTGHHNLEINRSNRNHKPKRGIDVIRRNLPKLDISINDINHLNIIHVAGTKGKGSVCAYTESILRASGAVTGLFTSPHLTTVRDRFRISAQPLAQPLFVKYFHEVWNRLSAEPDPELGYSQFLTLLSYSIFKQQNVDTCIYETVVGGKYDSTNIVSHPIATGISILDIDHASLLGHGPYGTIAENIAWHKAGIMKTGCPAFSVQQPQQARGVLESRAIELATELKFIDLHLAALRESSLSTSAQYWNASLAINLAEAYIKKYPRKQVIEFDQAVAIGLRNCVWEGRFQKISHDACNWYIDGAHNKYSILIASEWFASKVLERSKVYPYVPHILIFNQQAANRGGDALLKSIFDTCKHKGVQFDYAIFTTNEVWEDGTVIDDFVNNNRAPDKCSAMQLQKCYAECWKSLASASTIVETASTIEGAMQSAKMICEKAGGGDIFITGSLHLVGGVLYFLKSASSSRVKLG